MDIDTILDYLKTVDPVLAEAGMAVKTKITILEKQPSTNYLSDLCESIVSQQLSVKAASTIWSRTHGVVSNWNDPNEIIAATIEDLRGCGLSGQKASYVKNIASAVLTQDLHLSEFDTMSDADVITELVRVKGIGQWTAEMFLLFSLAREDIFSAGDLGLRNGVKKLYGLQIVSPGEAKELAEKWSPYRSTASRILWKLLDNEPLVGEVLNP